MKLHDIKILNSTISPSNSIINNFACTSILVLVVIRNSIPKKIDDELGELSSSISRI